MNEKGVIRLREATGNKPNPEGLLQAIVDEVKDLGVVASSSGKKWLRAKADQESIRIKEIQSRILQGIAQLDIERQKILQEYHLERQRLASSHEEQMIKLDIEREREKRRAIKDSIKVIKSLREMGIDIDLRIIQGNVSGLFDKLVSLETAKDIILKDNNVPIDTDV